MTLTVHQSVRSPFVDKKSSALLPTPEARYAIMRWPPESAVVEKAELFDYGNRNIFALPKRVKFDAATSVRVTYRNTFIEFEDEEKKGMLGAPRRQSCPGLLDGSVDYDFDDPNASSSTLDSPVMRGDSPPPPPPLTTYMIRNIPTRFTSITFVRLLDEYGFRNTFDFFYLPMDFRSGKNMGYAFINFKDSTTGVRFVGKFHDRRLPVSTSKKVIEVSPSRRQGLQDNIALFRTSDLLNSVSLPHYKPLISSEKTNGNLVPLSDTNFPPP